MLFKRYASPFDFLDGISMMGTFEQSLANLVEEAQNEKLWDVYLHSFSKKSFKEWKDEVMQSVPKKTTVEMTNEEIATQYEKAEKLLNSLVIERSESMG